MNYNYLRYFSVLAQVEHYTLAAARLGISQPSLSSAIHHLEDELGGVQLFEKVGRNIRLTEEGREILTLDGRDEDDIRLRDGGSIRRLSRVFQDQLHIICVLFTEDIGGIILFEFDKDGKLSIRTEAKASDYDYDEIGAALEVKEIQKQRRDMMNGLELYYEAVVLHPVHRAVGEDDVKLFSAAVLNGGSQFADEGFMKDGSFAGFKGIQHRLGLFYCLVQFGKQILNAVNDSLLFCNGSKRY